MNEETGNNETGTRAQGAAYPRPSLAFYHPNGKGTGSAVRLELHPAHDRTSGSIWLTAANQMTIGDRRGANPTFPRFDWEGRIVVKLEFDDLCKMLQVFRGECEDIGEGRGIYHRSATATTKIVLRHLVEPIPGYSLELYRTPTAGEEMRARFFFNPGEALGLSEAIAGSMSVICFGIPVVVPHAADRKEVADAAAA